MKHATTFKKVGILFLIIAFVGWFLPEMLHVPASGSLLEKLLLIRPIVLAIRISLIAIAFGITGFAVAVFWKEIGIVKIGSAGVEFGRLDEFSNKTQKELAEKNKLIEELQAEIEALKKEKNELKKYAKPEDHFESGVKS
jgi:hypothetical protein